MMNGESVQPLEFYKDIPDEKFIRGWMKAADPKYYYYISSFYTSPPWLWNREMIHWRGLEKDPRVIKADIEVIKLVLQNGEVEGPDFAQLDFEKDPPLEFWWYYLDRIEKGTYPLELLPDHLKDIYTEHLKSLFQLHTSNSTR